MHSRIYKTDALILRRHDFGEADRLIMICTPQGKRHIIAKGVRKTTSRLAGHIELFAHVRMMLAKGRNLDVITQSQVLNQFRRLRSDLSLLGRAYYVAELYDAFTQDEEANEQLFSLMIQTFHALDHANQVDLVLRTYELHILNNTGYRPHLHHCAMCHCVLTEQDDRFSPSSGGVLCRDHGRSDPLALSMSLSAFKLLRYIQRHSLSIVGQLHISSSTIAEVEFLLRAYLKHLLERELKTVAFIDTLRMNDKTPVKNYTHDK